MRIGMFVALLLLSAGFYLASNTNENWGKTPQDEEVLYSQERNKVTGELLNLQVVKCLICGQVLSYVQYNLGGKLVYGRMFTHRCGRYNRDLVRYKGSSLSDLPFNLIQWLEAWQRRLKVKR